MASKDIRAPRNTQFGGAGGGSVSFEVYFLRDLLAKGKITDKLLDDVIRQNHIPVQTKDVLNALNDSSGNSLPRGLANHLSDIAAVIAGNN